MNDHFEYWFLYMNTDLWNKLSAADKTLIQNAANEMEQRRWGVAEQDEQANEKRLADNGIAVIKFKDAELAKMATKVRGVAWPVIKKEIGADFFDQVTSSIK